MHEESLRVVYPPGISHFQMLAPFRKRLSAAQVFVLDKDTTAMAAHVSLQKPSSIIAAMKWVRLPFETTWVEFVNDDLRNAMAEYGSPNVRPDSAKVHLKRTGFLMRRHGDGIIGEYASHCRSFKSGTEYTDIAPIRFYYDLTPADVEPADRAAVMKPDYQGATGRLRDRIRLISTDPKEIAAEDDIRRRFRWEPHPDCRLAKQFLALQIGPDEVSTLEHEQAQEAYRLFTMQILPALILLNCRNAVDTELVPAPSKLNKSRASAGRPPMVEHRLIKMHLTKARQKRIAEARDGGRSVRGSLVIGHFKTRETGVFWWTEHARAGYGAVTNRRVVTL